MENKEKNMYDNLVNLKFTGFGRILNVIPCCIDFHYSLYY